MRTRLFSTLAIVVTCAVLTACAASFSKPLAYGYSTLTAVNDTTTEALEAGDITAARATEVLAISTCIDGILDSAARVWQAGQTAEAQAQLATAIALISELQTYSGDWTDERCSP